MDSDLFWFLIGAAGPAIAAFYAFRQSRMKQTELDDRRISDRVDAVLGQRIMTIIELSDRAERVGPVIEEAERIARDTQERAADINEASERLRPMIELAQELLATTKQTQEAVGQMSIDFQDDLEAATIRAETVLADLSKLVEQAQADAAEISEAKEDILAAPFIPSFLRNPRGTQVGVVDVQMVDVTPIGRVSRTGDYLVDLSVSVRPGRDVIAFSALIVVRDYMRLGEDSEARIEALDNIMKATNAYARDADPSRRLTGRVVVLAPAFQITVLHFEETNFIGQRLNDVSEIPSMLQSQSVILIWPELMRVVYTAMGDEVKKNQMAN